MGKLVKPPVLDTGDFVGSNPTVRTNMEGKPVRLLGQIANLSVRLERMGIETSAFRHFCY